MFQAVKFAVASLLLAIAVNAAAQSGYQVVSLNSSGAIVGTVKWSGPLPRLAAYPITKDPAICDPESHKTRDLERLIVGPQSGVANKVVFLKNISSGKAMEMPEPRRFLDQRHCRYEPHILLVPQEAAFDVLTERRIQRPVFTEPKTWEQHVTVNADEKAVVNFVIAGK